MNGTEDQWPVCVESFDSPQYPPHNANPASSYLIIEPDGRMVWLCDSDCLLRHYAIEWEKFCQRIAESH